MPSFTHDFIIVSKFSLDTIIKSCVKAPNASNRQSYSIIVLDDKEKNKLGLKGDKVLLFLVDFHRHVRLKKYLEKIKEHRGAFFFTADVHLSAVIAHVVAGSSFAHYVHSPARFIENFRANHSIYTTFLKGRKVFTLNKLAQEKIQKKFGISSFVWPPFINRRRSSPRASARRGPVAPGAPRRHRRGYPGCCEWVSPRRPRSRRTRPGRCARRSARRRCGGSGGRPFLRRR